MSEVGKLNPFKATPPVESNKKKVTDDKLKEVATLYERHFIREMMKQMRATVQEGGFIKQNNAEKIFRDQLDDQYADQWAQSGGIGLSGMIYDQLIEKFGVRLGLKAAPEKPQGPIPVNEKMQFRGATIQEVKKAVLEDSLSLGKSESTEKSDSNSQLTFQFSKPDQEKSQITSPWAGVLLDKKFLEMDRVQYRIKHDNGLESLIMTQGTGLGPDQKLSQGDAIAAGEPIGWMNGASPLFWTIKPNVSE
jgi:flagellar protein FlgJ